MKINFPSIPLAVGALTIALAGAVIGMAPANAETGVFVTTQSGATTCNLLSNQVACEHASGFWQTAGRYGMAVVGQDGTFQWIDGDIGTCEPDCGGGPTVLTYGTEYHIKGWTIEPSSDGTSFTNDRSGRGMFVSIQNVDSF
ncbi:hypothetical protein H7K45_16190 [Mycobacterium yunnanensis]|uniref:Uncharacterized protein n=1 Tax=Mycobacterium yunnanensis TaxID=368477 RepID=A0A9X3C305_9MYCO|nr:hypothetical protein [Mycobacterium yunnanensis]MCV7422091.1 hypothetical protein [Mycobacterium yunnanensis]